MASTGYRFMRYYTRDPAYRKKGPPRADPADDRADRRDHDRDRVRERIAAAVRRPIEQGPWLALHKVSFIVWIVFTALHVLAAPAEASLARSDRRLGSRRSRRLSRRRRALDRARGRAGRRTGAGDRADPEIHVVDGGGASPPPSPRLRRGRDAALAHASERALRPGCPIGKTACSRTTEALVRMGSASGGGAAGRPGAGVEPVCIRHPAPTGRRSRCCSNRSGPSPPRTSGPAGAPLTVAADRRPGSRGSAAPRSRRSSRSRAASPRSTRPCACVERVRDGRGERLVPW